jgi:hypothetical protein
MLYLHHVPGRLRLRLAALKGDGPAVARACAVVRAIPAILDARANRATGSLVIHYDPQRLTPDELWAALRVHGLVSGPSPLASGTGAICVKLRSPPEEAADWRAFLARAALDRLASALLGALV